MTRDLSQFRWRSAEGDVYTLETITTDHAVNVIRMIWSQLSPKLGASCPERPEHGRICLLSGNDQIMACLVLMREMWKRRSEGEQFPKWQKDILNHVWLEMCRVGANQQLLEDLGNEERILESVS